MLLTELFTQPADYQIIQNDGTLVIGQFKIGTTEYEMVGDERSSSVNWFNKEYNADIDDLWEFFFTAKVDGQHTYDVTQTGNAATVFATVIDFIKQVISQKDLDAIAVSTYRTEQTRLKLYRRMASTLANRFGWTVVEDEKINPESVVFIVYKEEQ